MDYRSFLEKLPKVELHCHLEGSVRASTFAELAAKHGLELPPYEQPEDLYHFENIGAFFKVYTLVCHALRDRDDFRRATYESLQDGAAHGLRYREMFWNPQIHVADGLPYDVMVDGIIDGIRDAARDFGVRCSMIASIALFTPSEAGVQMVETMLANPRDEVIGIGMDFGERGNPPQKFFDAYRLAKQSGLHLCGHTGQITPAANVEYCVDQLGVERIDHGYSVVLDDRILRRCIDAGVLFTVCPTATQIVYFPWDLGKHPIRQMVSRGLKVTIGTDDPTMCWTDLGTEYVLMADHMGYGPADFKQFILNGLEGCWVDEDTKRTWRAQWADEIDQLTAQVEGFAGLQYHLDLDTTLWQAAALPQPGLLMRAAMA